MKKKIFDRLSWLNEEGPFITVFVPSTFVVREIDKDRLQFKNLMKDAKENFNLKYPQRDFTKIEKRMEEVYFDTTNWRQGANTKMFIFHDDHHALINLGVDVKPEVYVDEIPYIIPLIEDVQFMTHLYILALNRDSFKLYEFSARELLEVEMDENAPITMDKAIGKDYNIRGYPSGASRVVGGDNVGYYGGVGATRDERSVDLVNYYQTVDRYLNDILDYRLPVILFALPENRSVYMDVSKLINLDENMAVLTSPEDFDQKHVHENVIESLSLKNQRQVDRLYNKLNKYTSNALIEKDLVKLMRNSKDGVVDTLLIAKERIEPQDYETNQIVKNVLDTGGDVYVLEADRKLGPDKLTALLRYKV